MFEYTYKKKLVSHHWNFVNAKYGIINVDPTKTRFYEYV
jgi:hypothetical protein